MAAAAVAPCKCPPACKCRVDGVCKQSCCHGGKPCGDSACCCSKAKSCAHGTQKTEMCEGKKCPQGGSGSDPKSHEHCQKAGCSQETHKCSSGNGMMQTCMPCNSSPGGSADPCSKDDCRCGCKDGQSCTCKAK